MYYRENDKPVHETYVPPPVSSIEHFSLGKGEKFPVWLLVLIVALVLLVAGWFLLSLTRKNRTPSVQKFGYRFY